MSTTVGGLAQRSVFWLQTKECRREEIWLRDLSSSWLWSSCGREICCERLSPSCCPWLLTSKGLCTSRMDVLRVPNQFYYTQRHCCQWRVLTALDWTRVCHWQKQIRPGLLGQWSSSTKCSLAMFDSTVSNSNISLTTFIDVACNCASVYPGPCIIHSYVLLPLIVSLCPHLSSHHFHSPDSDCLLINTKSSWFLSTK